MDIKSKLKQIFEDSMQQKDEENIKVNVKKNPKVANLSGQAKTPGDIEDQQKLESGDIEVNDLIKKINALRAGHSLKDKEIAISLEEYFTGLDVAEKTALFTYIKAIAEIVSGIQPGKSAIEPDDENPDVTMQKGNLEKEQPVDKSTNHNSIHKKANVNIDKKEVSKQSDSNSLPIVPKK